MHRRAPPCRLVLPRVARTLLFLFIFFFYSHSALAAHLRGFGACLKPPRHPPSAAWCCRYGRRVLWEGPRGFALAPPPPPPPSPPPLPPPTPPFPTAAATPSFRMESHSSIAVALGQALAVRDEAALSSCLDGTFANQGRAGLAVVGNFRGACPPLAHWCSCRHCMPPPLTIAVQEPAVVTSSVARLSAAQAALLLEELMERLHSQPQQATRLALWLRSLLLSHGATLAAGPTGQVSRGRGNVWLLLVMPVLFVKQQGSCRLHSNHCYGCMQATMRRAQMLLEQRTASYSSLLELSGRLAMLQSGASAGGPDAAAASPAVFFSA